MECLQTLLEDEGIQNFLEEKESDIVACAESFHEFPQVIKDYVLENLSDFIGDTVADTHQNIVEFTENSAFQFLNELVDGVEV